MDVLSQPQAEPTQGSFPRAGWVAEAEELPTDKGQVSNQDSQGHPWSQIGGSPGGLETWGSASAPDSTPESFTSDQASLWDPWLNNET